MIVYLDFDGTVVTHEFPHIGRLLPGSIATINHLLTAGHEVIINTQRIKFPTDHFKIARRYLENIIGVPFPHTEKKIHPLPWNIEIAKESGILFIDDIAPNIPTHRFADHGGESVDWFVVQTQLIEAGIINITNRI